MLFEHILRAMPAELQPSKGTAWSRVRYGDAVEWFTHALYLRPFDSRLHIQSVAVQENPARRDDPAASPWQITIGFVPMQTAYHGQTFAHVVVPLHLFADDATAAHARRLKTDEEVRVTGRIRTIRNSTWTRWEIELRDAVVSPPMRPGP